MAKKSRGHEVYRQVVEEHQARLERLTEKRGVNRLRKVYRDSQAEVEDRIKRLVSGRKGSTFEAFQKRAIMAQLVHGQVYVMKQVGGELADAARDTQHDVLRALSRDLGRLERNFTGEAPIIPVEDAARFQGVLDGQRQSMLRRHASSLENFGASNVARVEDELSKSLLQGESQHEAINRVVETLDTEWWRGERIVRCLPGETRVTAAVVRAVFRRWYDGPMIEIVTERGAHFSATPNHPMLTTRGWVLQGRIVKGDYLVCDGRQQDVGSSGNQDVARRPATIAEIFDTASAVGVCERRNGTDPDFHGDGREGDVDIARPNRELMYGIFAPLTKPSSQHLFSASDELRNGGARFCSLCSALLPHESACLCDRSDLHAHGPEAARYHAMVYSVRCSYLWAAFSGFVALADLLLRKLHRLGTLAACNPVSHGFGQGAASTALVYVPFDTPTRNAEPDPHLAMSKSGDIQVDRVLDVRVREFSGHVFNVSTPFGYFAANGYYTGNTELAWTANATQADGMKEAREVLPDLMMQWRELVSEDGTPLDDRVGVDSIAMNLQVAAPGQMFVCPPRTVSGEKVPDSLAYETVAFPPLRPNDRASLTPWRSGWGIPAYRYVGGRRVPMR